MEMDVIKRNLEGEDSQVKCVGLSIHNLTFTAHIAAI